MNRERELDDVRRGYDRAALDKAILIFYGYT
jgi:hypothetical protein